MPWLIGGALALFGLGVVATSTGVAVDNATQKAPQPAALPLDSSVPDIIKWPLIIGGTVLLIQYGKKLIK